MPASEEFFRDQKKLHVIFAVSSIGLLASIVWMFSADYLLKWKDYQIEFSKLKKAKLTDDKTQAEKKVDPAKLRELETQLAKAKQEAEAKADERRQVERQLKDVTTQLNRADEAMRFLKADDVAISSIYDLKQKALYEAEFALKEAHDEKEQKKHADRVGLLQKELAAAKAKVDSVQANLLAKTNAFDKIKVEKKALEAKLVEMNKAVEDLAAKRTALTTDVDKLSRSANSAEFSFWPWMASLPILDGLNSPLKIKQQVLRDLTLDYNFAKVIRFDRCMTCHLGADQPGFEADNRIKQPYCSHPHQDLYVNSQSKHPVEKFGCTVCHGGQGTSTSFEWSSHTPADNKQTKEWTEKYGWFYNHFHEEPMRHKQFVEASCIKCHHDPYEIPQATKVLKGYQTIQLHGCYGCHEIAGYKDDGTAIGPNLRIPASTDTPEMKAKSLPKAGPGLARVSEKLSTEFMQKWIRNPQAFRPTSRMPNFYYQMEDGFYGEGPAGEFDFKIDENEDKKYNYDHGLKDLSDAEIATMTLYLNETSKEYIKKNGSSLPKNAPAGDPAKGKQLFATKGCTSCHNHKDQEIAKTKEKNFGPDLSDVGAKFTTPEQKAWLTGWIQNPSQYYAETKMPSLQLSAEDSAHIAAYLTSVPAKWAKEISARNVEQLVTKVSVTDASGAKVEKINDPIRDLVLSILVKSKSTKREALDTLNAMDGKAQAMYLGKATIGKLGCFACHDIPGFEDAKPIGAPLNDWGKKDPHKLAFENAADLVNEQAATPGSYYSQNDYFVWAVNHHQREGFLMQKLRDPRSYDHKKIRRWEDRTRMPKFNFDDSDREAVSTFVLGLVAEEMNRKYVYTPSKEKRDAIKGMNLLNRYNCVACHVIEPGKYEMVLPEKFAASLQGAAKSSLDADFDQAFISAHNAWAQKGKKLEPGNHLIASALPYGKESADEAENPDDPINFFSLWGSTSIKGQTVPAGLKFNVPTSVLKTAKITPPIGGQYALNLVDYLVSKSGNPNNPAERDTAWAKSPPPLIREGEKVQTNWLYRFLREPVSIRPAVVLRMPKFNYKEGDVETLANFFAAQDNQPYPYVEQAEREDSYLTEKSKTLGANHLDGGWKLVTNQNLCVKCHPIGGRAPSGKPEEQGPSLARAHERLRPDWIARWVANPKRFLPYTGMPVNFEKSKSQYQEDYKSGAFEQVIAVRDALTNYPKVAEELLSKTAPPATPATNPAPAPANPPADAKAKGK